MSKFSQSSVRAMQLPVHTSRPDRVSCHQQGARNSNTSIRKHPRKINLRRPTCKSADITFLDKQIYLLIYSFTVYLTF